MCLITLGKSNDVRTHLLDTPHLLEDVFQSNSDGFGVMFAHDTQLVVAKTVPTTAEEARAWLTATLPTDGREVAVHARYATHGAVGRSPDGNDNTHPYPVDGGYLMHNGILHQTTDDSRDGNSDTWHYCRRYLDGAAHAILATPGGVELLADHIGNNRFVFLDRSGRMTIVNREQGLEHEGVWYSNTYAWSPELLIPSYRARAPQGRYWSTVTPASTYDLTDADTIEWVADTVDSAMEGIHTSDLQVLLDEGATRSRAIRYVLDNYHLWRYHASGADAGYEGSKDFETLVSAWVTCNAETLNEAAARSPALVAEALLYGCDWRFEYPSVDGAEDALDGMMDDFPGLQLVA